MSEYKEDGAGPDTKQSKNKPKSSSINEACSKINAIVNLKANSYWMTRVVFLHFLGLVYCVAFLVAWNQNKALLGTNGLLPADVYMNRMFQFAERNTVAAFQYVPTLFWLLDWENNIDFLLDATALTGFLLALFVCITGSANVIIMLTLWILYHAIVNVGQRWYGFGWESQLLETGFLSISLVPVLKLERFPRQTPTPWVAVWGYRWLIFRIMIGAGLIKIRGDKCWRETREFTCMDYHYETQPVPNPVAYYLHQMPKNWHKFEILTNHFAELVAPWLIFCGRKPRIFNGVVQIMFMGMIIVSGNLSFLNHLTMLPSIMSFDDKFLAKFFSKSTIKRVAELQSDKRRPTWGEWVRSFYNVSLAIIIGYLSIPIVQNLFSARQVMNTSFEPLRIVNTYGAFGTVTKKRTEVVLEGTLSSDPRDSNAEWLEYEFKCKPGNVTRRPCLISPYHYRLDWLMWFSAFQNYQQNPWLLHLMGKLLSNDEMANSLIDRNPFAESEPPKWIRAQHYRYKFTKAFTGARDWWQRELIGSYAPAVNLASLKSLYKSQSWKMPKHLKKGMASKKKHGTSHLKDEF